MGAFTGRQALITGGARGLGRRMAQEIVRRGGRVALWDLDGEALEATVAELLRGAPGGSEGERPVASGAVVDVGDFDAVQAEAARVGAVDVLINNAGVVSGRSLMEATEADIRRTFAVNSLALFWTTKAFLPGMIARGHGHVVTVASAAGIIGIRGLVDYCASKHAAVGFDEALRMELRSQAPGVKTTVVCPIFINTGMFKGVTSPFPRLLPILEEAEVARQVVDAVEAERPRLLLPPLVFATFLARFLPVPLFDAAAERLGIHTFMQGFQGHDR